MTAQFAVSEASLCLGEKAPSLRELAKSLILSEGVKLEPVTPRLAVPKVLLRLGAAPKL